MALLTPEDVQVGFDRMGILARFTPHEVIHLSETRPPERNGFLTFATPEDRGALSIAALREALGVTPQALPSFFDHPWYLEEAFGQTLCRAGWHSIAMEVSPDTVGRPVYHAETLKPSGTFLPSAVGVVLMLFLHFVLNGKRLLWRSHTWTEDRTDDGRFVSVGAFGRNGVFLSSHAVGYTSRGLGICPAVMP